MAKGDVTFSRREHKELLEHLATIEKHHTRRMDPETQQVIEPSFAHDDELHEDTDGQDPQCIVLTAVQRMRAIHQSKE